MTPEGERGSTTIFASVALLVLLSLVVLVIQLGAATATRHRDQAAADLAALAAAGVATDGSAAACATASDISARMHVTVRTCTLTGWDAVVVVETRVHLGAFGSRAVTAVAKAGPAAIAP